MCSEEERQLTQQKLCEVDRRDLCSKVKKEWHALTLAVAEEAEDPEEPIEVLTPEKLAEFLIEKYPEKKIYERVYHATDEAIYSSYEKTSH